MLYDKTDAEWRGFEAIRLPFSPAMYLIPLFGHTRGHCGVVMQDGDRWVFQCADAAPVRHDYGVTPAWLNRIVLGTHLARLRAFAEGHPDVRMLAGNMWRSFFDSQAAG